MTNKLPPCFAFRNSGKHPRKDEIKKRFNKLDETVETGVGRWAIHNTNYYYGRLSDGVFFTYYYISAFGSTVVEITEDDFLAMTEPELTELPKEKGLYKKYFIQKIVRNPDYLNKVAGTFMGEDATPEFILKPTDSDAEYFVLRLDDGCSDSIHVEACRQAVLTYATVIRNHLPELSEDLFKKYSKNTIPAEPELTKLPDNFYFQYVDEKDREVLKERFGRGSDFCCPTSYYGKLKGSSIFQSLRESSFEGATKITQADFIRLTEPEKKVEPEPSALTGQIIEISKRTILISLTQEQIKEFKIFETVTIK